MESMEKGDLDKKTLSDNYFLSWMNTTATASASATDIQMAALPLSLPLHHQQLDASNYGGANEISASHAAAGDDFGKNSTIMQPFHHLYPSSGMAAEFPFTSNQWRELERQAMVYKCMISAVPVPPHLLFPIDSSSLPLYGDRYSRKGDAEPGRCKRTDGKKWRCSREVAPEQKYCERHLHRGRPRSRKPVEPNAKTRLPRTKSQIQPKSHPPISNGEITRDLPWEKPNPGFSGFDQNYLFCFSAPEMSGFVDMNSGGNRGSVESSEGDLSPSLNLSVGMAAGEEQMKNVVQRDWEALGLGPLGEALQPASPYNSMSTPATSPSGVLHWNLFSHSDGSVCNSPSLAAAAEMASHSHWQI